MITIVAKKEPNPAGHDNWESQLELVVKYLVVYSVCDRLEMARSGSVLCKGLDRKGQANVGRQLRLSPEP
jgi:hypothetical protein